MDLHTKLKLIKLLENKTGESLDSFVYCDAFVDTIPKAEFMRQIIFKMDLIKTCQYSAIHCEENEKAGHKLWENIFEGHTVKQLLSEIYKELLKSTIRNQTPNLKMSKKAEQTPHQRRHIDDK